MSAVPLTMGWKMCIRDRGKADFDAWDGGLAAEAEADDVPLPLEAEVTNLPIREQRRG